MAPYVRVRGLEYIVSASHEKLYLTEGMVIHNKHL